MDGTDLAHFDDLVSPEWTDIQEIPIEYEIYEYDQHRDFEHSPWQTVKFFAPTLAEYPGLDHRMSMDDVVDLNIRKHTEFLLERNSDTLVVAVGESWTFGETVRTTLKSKDHFSTAMHATLGARIAAQTHSDLHQHAIPGNCTAFIFDAAQRILAYHSENSSYKKIYLVLHITDLNRDLQYGNVDYLDPYSATSQLIQHCSNHSPYTVEEFYSLWERYYFDYLDNICDQYQDQVDTVLYKNLTHWYCDKSHRENRKFHVIEPCWLSWLADHNNRTVPLCYFFNAGQMEQSHSVWQYAVRDADWISNQLDNIEQYIELVQKHGGEYHTSHPNQLAHNLWADYICQQVGWP